MFCWSHLNLSKITFVTQGLPIVTTLISIFNELAKYYENIFLKRQILRYLKYVCENFNIRIFRVLCIHDNAHFISAIFKATLKNLKILENFSSMLGIF